LSEETANQVRADATGDDFDAFTSGTNEEIKSPEGANDFAAFGTFLPFTAAI
jgi:hypothetical protein